MVQKKYSESGMVIVEATIVFPVMFLVVFLMIFAGNAYLQKCRVEAIVNEMTIDGAAYCADPMLDNVEADIVAVGKIDKNTFSNADIRPYRYFGKSNMDDIVSEIESKVNNKFSNLSTGLFSNMKPSSPKIEVNYNNGFIYSTFSVDIEYKVEIPVRLLGASDYISLHIFTHANMPVSDSPEFIRNVDMIEDYMEKYGVKEKIEETKKKITDMMDKAKEWMNK